MTKTYPYRAFISYAHDDRPVIEQIIAALAALGFHILWDDDLPPGRLFTNSIKDLITRSHVFIPIITEQSRLRPWVHQEIGMAIAFDIPIVPLTVGAQPGEMIAAVQAININADLSNLKDCLEKVNWERQFYLLLRNPTA